MSESVPEPSARSTFTGITAVLAYATPAMPTPSSALAAAIVAVWVPCPLTSLAGSEPSKDHPAAMRPARSGAAPSTPVSSTASVTLPDMVATPWTSSHPIVGRSHWLA